MSRPKFFYLGPLMSISEVAFWNVCGLPFRHLWGDVNGCYMCLLLYPLPSQIKFLCKLSWSVGRGKSNRALTCAYNFILCSSTSISCHNGCKISLVSQSRHNKRSSLDKEVASVCILQFFNSCNLSVLLEMTTDVTTLHSILVGHVSAE